MNLVAQNFNASSVFLSRSELDEFLFAPVIEDSNGMTVSVLSMLARAGVDPRSEAAELARLTGSKATDALTLFIAGLPEGLVPRCDTETIAARLAALLPRRTKPASPPSQAKMGSTQLTQRTAVAIAAILICFLIGAIWVAAVQQSMAQIGGPVPASAVGAAHTPPQHAVR
jgi:hypothetical protein